MPRIEEDERLTALAHSCGDECVTLTKFVARRHYPNEAYRIARSLRRVRALLDQLERSLPELEGINDDDLAAADG